MLRKVSTLAGIQSARLGQKLLPQRIFRQVWRSNSRELSSTSTGEDAGSDATDAVPPPPPLTPPPRKLGPMLYKKKVKTPWGGNRGTRINSNGNHSNNQNSNGKGSLNDRYTGKNSNSNNENKNKWSSKQTDEQIIEESRKAIWKAELRKNPVSLMDSFEPVFKRGLELGLREYIAVLWGCEQLPIDDPRSVQAYWVYSALKRSGPIPLDCYQRVMAVCAKRGDGNMAEQVVSDYRNEGFPVNETFLMNAITAMAKDRNMNISRLSSFYQEWHEEAVERGWIGTRALYTSVVVAFTSKGRAEESLLVLRHMTEAQHEPTLSLCNLLLEHSLWHGQTDMLRVLSQWYYDNFNVKLDRGIIKRMLQLGGVYGDDILAQTSIKLLEKSAGNGVVAAGAGDYACWMRACMEKGDIIGALEALISASTAGVDMHEPTDEWSINGGWELQEQLAQSLAKSVRMLDNVYFALVDLVRGDYQVPPMALHAIIMASGHSGKLDRSFATFTEIESLFGLNPDIHAYNALLWANSKCLLRANGGDLGVMLSIVEKLEDSGLTANDRTFDIIFNCVAEHANFGIHHHSINHSIWKNHNLNDIYKDLKPLPVELEPLLTMVANQNITIKPNTLRKLCKASSMRGDWDLTGRLITMLENNVGEQNIHRYFLKLIDSISKEKPLPHDGAPVRNHDEMDEHFEEEVRY